MEKSIQFTKDILQIKDVGLAVEQICNKLKTDIFHILGRRGGVVGISGGIDSSVTLALAARALGAANVVGIIMPEKDSSPESKILAQDLGRKLGVRTIVEDISMVLEGFHCYSRRDEAVKKVVPDYNPQTDKMSIGINAESILKDLPPVFYVKVIYADGTEDKRRLPVDEYLQIVAASNFKQRSRMSFLYYHAESLRYAVVGTPNIHEVKQGFFVKYGDGGADVIPIGCLYKSQVYQLAHYLNIPQAIISRTPTTDTYSADQSQEEFFYQVPFEEMDLMWYGWEKGYSPDEVASALGKSKDSILKNFKNFQRKQKSTEYLRMSPISDYNFFN